MALHLDIIQHVPFEEPGLILAWADGRQAHSRIWHPYHDGKLPNPGEQDMLVLMGGPMSVSDADQLAWLENERSLLTDPRIRETPALGICLGAQLMADSLGAVISSMGTREIGWHPLQTKGPSAMPFLPESLIAFHWHGQQFSLPEGASGVYSSQACSHQDFMLGKWIGLQYHLEVQLDNVQELLKHCVHELDGGPWTQSEALIVGLCQQYQEINRRVLFDLLNHLLESN